MQIPVSSDFYALVDPEDGELLLQYKWRVRKGRNTLYAERSKQGIKMHNQIMNPPPGLFVDHINRNGLDNRRSNLRLATASENMRNRRKFKNSTSKYRGVSKRSGSRRNCWQASIRHDGKLRYLGSYSTEEEAALVYDAAARELHGDFAELNF